jgi:hypothetical protein
VRLLPRSGFDHRGTGSAQDLGADQLIVPTSPTKMAGVDSMLVCEA